MTDQLNISRNNINKIIRKLDSNPEGYKFEILAVALGIKLGAEHYSIEETKILEWISFLQPIFPELYYTDHYVYLLSNINHQFVKQRVDKTVVVCGKSLGYVCGDMKGWNNPHINRTFFGIELYKNNFKTAVINEVCPYDINDIRTENKYQEFILNNKLFSLFSYFGYTFKYNKISKPRSTLFTEEESRTFTDLEFPEDM